GMLRTRTGAEERRTVLLTSPAFGVPTAFSMGSGAGRLCEEMGGVMPSAERPCWATSIVRRAPPTGLTISTAMKAINAPTAPRSQYSMRPMERMVGGNGCAWRRALFSAHRSGRQGVQQSYRRPIRGREITHADL